MFSGLESIDWGSMQHAYGPATDVPALLRALVSDDPAARERGLDGMVGAVHHQGDVYECTVAAIPFLLEAAAVPGLPGRGGVLDLLASIGGADADDAVKASEHPTYTAAHATVGAACPLFLSLLGDPDPQVRRAAPKALQACRNDAKRVVAALRERPLEAEADAEVRGAIIAAVGTFGRRAATGQLATVDAAEVAVWLANVAGQPRVDPETRLAAVAELAQWAPVMLPPNVSEVITDLLQLVYASAEPGAPPAGFSTSTLTGALREIAEREAADRTAPQAAAVVAAVSLALGDRVTDRVALLTRLLREQRWEARHDALRPARVLIEGWRASYAELVFLMGQQLLDSHPRLAAVAADALEYLDAEAAPAAGALAQSLDAAPREGPYPHNDGLPPWVITWGQGLPGTGPVLKALAALRDTRARRAIRWALERPGMPSDIGYVAGQFGPAAADLVPLIRRRLRELPPAECHDQRRSGLVFALGRIGEAAAVAVPDLLALTPDANSLLALGQIGSLASDAVPTLRRWLRQGKPAVEIAAAAALWRVTAGAGMVLPTLTRHLASDDQSAVTAATRALAELGPAAASTAPRLRELLGSAHGSIWLRLWAAVALWRSTSEVDAALPVLSTAWQDNPHTRVDVAGYLAEMGQAAASAAPLLHAELQRRRRHMASDHSWSSAQVSADLALLQACHRGVGALAGNG